MDILAAISLFLPLFMATRSGSADQPSLLASMIPDRERASWLIKWFGILFGIIVVAGFIDSPKHYLSQPHISLSFDAMRASICLAIIDFIKFLDDRD